MKKLITIFGIAVLIFAGCSNPVETSIEPVNANFDVLNKSSETGTDNQNLLSNQLYVEKLVDGLKGDIVILTGQFINVYGDTVTADVKLTVPAGAFTGVKNISIRTEYDKPGFKFGPSGVFNKNLKLNASLRGIETARFGLDSGRTDFVYAAENGSKTLIKNDGIRVESSSKLVVVNGAQLPHFSRYIFIRKSSKNSSSSITD